MRIQVEGGAPLHGQYTPSGSANAAQAMMAAALLAGSPSTLHRVPRTGSTTAMIAAVEALGASAVWARDETASTVVIDPASLARRVLVQPESDATLAAMLLLAPLLVHRGHVRMEIDFPVSRIHPHIDALRELGFGVTTGGGALECTTTPRVAAWMTAEPREVTLLQTSVTATALLMMLGARLGRETCLRNAACEPHIAALAHMLNAMGARIEGIGSNVLVVHGAESLRGVEATVIPDVIEAASVAAMAALTSGRVQIGPIGMAGLGVIGRNYRLLGIEMEHDGEQLYLPRHEHLTLSSRDEDLDPAIESAPWPGFPSDLIAIATVIATQTSGTLLIHEKLFHNRLLFIDKLKAMGAQIVLCDPHRAIVMGGAPLHGIYMDTPDVRTGLGMLTAALAAHGTSTLDNAHSLSQTFDGVIEKLQALGARITVEQP